MIGRGLLKSFVGVCMRALLAYVLGGGLHYAVVQTEMQLLMTNVYNPLCRI